MDSKWLRNVSSTDCGDGVKLAMCPSSRINRAAPIVAKHWSKPQATI
jgi:hypothetical protein